MAAASALPSLRPQSSGSASGPTAVFVHGWPDDASLFAPMAARLARDFHCVCVTLPNFGPAGPGNVVKHSGYPFEVLAEALAALIIDTQRARGRPDEPVTLILHDWGCVIGYQMERKYPRLVSNVVAMDVGRHMAPSVFARIFIFLYQLYIILAWLLGFVAPKAGDAMIRAMARQGKVPSAEFASCHNGYPYVHYWRALASGSDHVITRSTDPRGLCPFPCLFLYGQPTGPRRRFKPVMFHSDAFLFAVSKRADSKAMYFDADHWFPVRSECADAVNEAVAKWLGERYAAGDARRVQ